MRYAFDHHGIQPCQRTEQDQATNSRVVRRAEERQAVDRRVVHIDQPIHWPDRNRFLMGLEEDQSDRM